MKQFTLVFFVIFSVTKILAQNYQITFVGAGANSTIDSVKVENLTQNTNISLKGSDILHLSGTVGINELNTDINNTIRIYPNPSSGICKVGFEATAQSVVTIGLYDITGKRILLLQELLAMGHHTYSLTGIRRGLYLLKVESDKYSYTAKIISSNEQSGVTEIVHIGTTPGMDNYSTGSNTDKVEKLKSGKSSINMQYTSGDLLKLTGFSGGIYRTIFMLVPAQSQTVTFNFVACADADGNNYPVVQIGTQIWMAENLQTTRYKDGTLIPNVTEAIAWSASNTGAYCWYNNNATNYQKLYGALYNWHAVNTNKLAPKGWHVPSDTEWKQLEMALGMTQAQADATGYRGTDQGTQLKNRSGWFDYGNGTNTSGFSALPGGFRHYYGDFGTLGDFGYWWSASENSSIEAWSRYLRYYWTNVTRYLESVKSGFSVRCVMDEQNVACGDPFTINHLAGNVAPVTKTVTYGTVTNIPGEPTKCWITSNLGASQQATAVNDATEASAGWYWQFNRKQGYKHDGTTRTPNTAWITSISESSDWIAANDPCTIELGSGWRIPTYTEWNNVDSSGSWTNWNGPWNSLLKLHTAGRLNNGLGYKGVNGYFWSSKQDSEQGGWSMNFASGQSIMSGSIKAVGYSLRCIKDAAIGNSTILVDTLINASASDVIITVENKIKVVIPKGTVLSNSRLTIEEEPESNYTELDIFKTHFIYNVKIAGQTTFNKPLIITFNYNPANLETGWTKDRLAPAYYNDTLKTWISYPDAVVDSVLNQITFTTNHLTPLTLTELLASFGYQHKLENEHFIVYYTYQGTHKVCDNDTYDSPSQPWHITEGPEKGTPFYIQDLAHWLNDSWVAYDGMEFDLPEEKIKVYVANIGGSYGQIETLTGRFYINNDVGTDINNMDFTRANILQSTVAHEMLHLVQGNIQGMVRAANNYRWWLEALATQGDRMVWGSALQHYESEFFCKKVTEALGNVLYHSLAFSWDKAIDWDWYAAGGFLAYLSNYRTGTKLNLVNAVFAGEEASNRNYIDNQIITNMGGTGIGTEYLNYVQWLYEQRHDKIQLQVTPYVGGNPVMLDATLTRANNSKRFSETNMPYLSTRLIKIKNTDIIENPEFEITISKPNPEIRMFLCKYANKKFSITAELNDKEKRNLSVINNTSQFDILIVNTSKDNNLPFDVTVAQKEEENPPAGIASLGTLQFVPDTINFKTSYNMYTIKTDGVADGTMNIVQKGSLDGLVKKTLKITWNQPPRGNFEVVDGGIFWRLNLNFDFQTIPGNGYVYTPNINIKGLSGTEEGSSGGYDCWRPSLNEPNFCLELAPDNFSVVAGSVNKYLVSKSYDISLKLDCGSSGGQNSDGYITFPIKINNFFAEDLTVVLNYLYLRD